MRVAPHWLLLLSVVGCIPVPHRIQEFPETQGILLAHGVPIADALVWQVPSHDKGACVHLVPAVRTDAGGHFGLRGSSRLGVVWYFPGLEYGHSWSVCVEDPTSGRTLQWRPEGLSPPYAPRRAALTCNVADQLQCEAKYGYE